MSDAGGRLRELFERALELPDTDREAFVELECAGDEALAGSLRDLLANDPSTHNQFLEGGTHVGVDAPAVVTAMPERIGGYRVVREIGRGGMGVVYEGEQESPRRRVALKVVRSGFLSGALVSRFRREAQVLAQLQHRGIAHIYESGAATLGSDEVPYFAMEFIDGRPLDEHARTNALSVRQRLELVARVCDAVQHAHQKGIIHRDLKPSNVLVVEEATGTRSAGDSATLIDAIGQPKILDFGIARFTDADVQATVQTSTGQIVGTLTYMSPEQVDGRPEELDTRCDVYALGVMLYAMLGGRPPHELGGLPIAEAARIIKDDEPRGLGSIDAALRGDIATIVSKAMDKDRERRYASAGLLAEDIRRFLRDEPISARAPSTFYQLSKFTRRNKALVGGVLATMIVLLAGLAASVALLVSTIHERDAKQAALDESNDVTEYFSSMLLDASPDYGDKDMTVREMLDRSAATISDRFGDRPLLEARLRDTMGETYKSLGEFDAAADQFAASIRLREGGAIASTSDLLEARVALSEVHRLNADYATSLAMLDAAIEAASGVPGCETPLAKARIGRAAALVRLGRLDEAAGQLESVIETFESTDTPAEVLKLSARAELAHIAALQGEERAEDLYRQLIEESTSVRGADHPSTLVHKSNLGAFYRDQKRNEEAIPLMREVYEAQTRVLGAAHRQTLISANNLAQVLAYAGRPDEARPILEHAIGTAHQEHGEDSASALFLLYTLGHLLEQEGALEEAERVMIRSMEAHRRVQGANAEGTYYAEGALRNLFITRMDFSKAIELGKGMVERATTTYPGDHPRVFQSQYDLARAYAIAERHADAEAMYLASYEHASPQWKGAIQRNIAKLYERWGKPDEAARWRDSPPP